MKMIDSTTDGLRVFKAKLLPFRLYLETAVCRLVIVDFFPIQHTERRKSSESLTFENGVFLGRRLFLLKTQTSDRQKKKKKKKNDAYTCGRFAKRGAKKFTMVSNVLEGHALRTPTIYLLPLTRRNFPVYRCKNPW